MRWQVGLIGRMAVADQRFTSQFRSLTGSFRQGVVLPQLAGGDDFTMSQHSTTEAILEHCQLINRWDDPAEIPDCQRILRPRAVNFSVGR